MIRAENLFKIYNTGENAVYALRDVSLTINAGDFVAIIGPSGSGKSTLMNILGCLDIPSSGKYYLDGIEVSQMDSNQQAEIRNQKLGFIFQGFNLLPKLTALENVELPLIYRGIGATERRDKSMKALASVGLENRATHRPTELSGGQQQRVAIARALAGNPPILMADEPTGNLDTKSGGEIIRIIEDLNNSGQTIILITHDLAVANRAKRVVRMQDGEIVADMAGHLSGGIDDALFAGR